MSDYVQITSISIDMSTEETPYNRIYAKPVEKQGDVLLCEFESANYDIEQKDLKEQNKHLKELLKEIRQQITEQVFGSPELQLFEGTFDNKLLTKIDKALK